MRQSPRRLLEAITPLARRVVFRKAGTLDCTPLSPELRTVLAARFRDDILRLQDLIGRDLSHWLQEPGWAALTTPPASGLPPPAGVIPTATR